MMILGASQLCETAFSTELQRCLSFTIVNRYLISVAAYYLISCFHLIYMDCGVFFNFVLFLIDCLHRIIDETAVS